MRRAGQGSSVGAQMGAFLGGLVGEGSIFWGQNAEKSGGQARSGSMARSTAFNEATGGASGADKACRQPVKGAALAAAGLSEHADGEGRGRVGAAQQFGKASEKRRGLRRQREPGGGNRRVSLETR